MSQIDFRCTTLENGLTVVGEIVPAAHSAAMGFFVKTGARDEDPAAMGVSHFLEHMMFKGTASRSAEDVDREFDEIGAEHNAFTTAEMTAFWAHCLPEHLMRAEEILADIMRPSIREEDFQAEKQVILEEIAMYRDHPFWMLYERAMEVYYGKHPLAHRVLGTEETVSALTRERMQDYFTQRYSADNTTVAVAGRVDFDAIVEQVKSHCGSWQRTDARRARLRDAHEPNEFTMTTPTVNRHYLLMIAPAPSLDDERRYASGMLSQILGDVDGSRLYWALVEAGLAEEAQAQYNGHDGTGDTLVFCICSPEDAAEVQRIVLREIDQLTDAITNDDLERARSKIATSVTLHGELPAGRMRRLGRQWTYYGEYRSLEEELDRINAVTIDELRSVAAAYPLHPVVIGHLEPER